MKKIFVLFSLLLCVSVGRVYAQSSMSDSQIMDFIVKENEKGTSRQQIMIKLMEKGVTVDRVRKLRNRYEKQKNGEIPGALGVSGYGDGHNNRLRRNNANDSQPNAAEERSTMSRSSQQNNNLSNMTERERRLWQERQRELMSDELGFLLPDTLDLYDDIMGRKENPKKRVFGRNIFNNKKLTFEGDMNIATPADYRLGPGDAVFVDVWGASQRSYEATVSPEGTINLEGFGPVSIGGMTVAQANRHLRSTLGSRYAGSQVKLSVGQTKTITVNVMGEVNNPGTYTLSAFSTVFNALYMAGGTNEIGTLRNIKIYRNGREISNVDIYDYILNGVMSGNVRLASGDVIIVGPYECLVQIDGKVRRPMYYEMKETESVGTLIKYAGGFTGDAYQSIVRLVRKAGGQFSVYSLDEFERSGFQLKDADSVYVDSTLNRYSNMVEVRGAVFRQGMYQMDGSISTVRQLIEAAGGPTEDAFLDHAVMHRRKEDRSLEVLSIDINALMNRDVPDIPLRNEDVLFVPNRSDMQEERILTIQGEVRYPGKYEFADNMSLEDFILQAGGLTDAASLMKVDISRRIRNQRATKESELIAQSFTFSLKDGFVVDGKPGFILKPFDEVYVRRSPGYVTQRHVTVEGEVAHEGIYVLTKKTSRLSDLVRQCGGLSPDAYAHGARLERRLTPEEKMAQQDMIRAVTDGDSVSLAKIELGDVRSVGINLDKAIAEPGNDEYDIVLRDGDRLIVPIYTNTVTVNGEVMYPNTVAFKKDAGLSYYINQAGGYSQKAKKSKTFVVNLNGTVTRVKKPSDIQPGANIVVPVKSRRNRLSFGEIMSLSTMGISMAAVIASLIKR